jgi:cyclopropane fatty-acyl-phospholipid synthase-like methyltransferase
VDLDHERQNIHRFRESVARQGFRIRNEDLIKVPEPVDELSSRTVLVMEYVSGVHPERYASLPVPPAQLADTLDDLEDLMVNFNGLVHGDLHPGNFYWTREGRVVLVDFGLVVELDRVDVECITSFFMGLVEGFDDYAVHIFLERLTEVPARDVLSRENYALLFREMHQVVVVDGHVGTGGRPRFYEMTVRLQQALHRFGLRAQDSYIQLFLALTSIEGYIYGLSPTFDMLEHARRKRLEAAEYVDIPQDVLEPAIGVATYSTAMSEFAADVEDIETAFVRTRRFVGEQLGVKPGDKVLDVGCGRGHLLTDLTEAFGAVSYGITLSAVEAAVCRDRGVEHVLHGSWEGSEPFLVEHGPFDHMAIIEMDCHMATLEENQNGFLEVKLDQLFARLHRHLVPGGRIFFQQLDIDDAVFADRALFTEIVETIPFMGFSRREQVDKAAKPYFELERNLSGTKRDLTMTMEFQLRRFEQHSAHFLAHMDKRLYDMIMRETRLTLLLAEDDLLRVNRFVLRARPEPDFSLSENLLSKFEIPRPAAVFRT